MNETDSAGRLQLVTTRRASGPGPANEEATTSPAAPPGRVDNATDEIVNETADGETDIQGLTARPGSGPLDGAAKARPEGVPSGDVTTDSKQNDWTIDELARLQEEDPDLSPVRKWLMEGQKPDHHTVMPFSRAVKSYCAQWAALTVENGIVYRRFLARLVM